MTTKPHRLEIAAQLMAAAIAGRGGRVDEPLRIARDCVSWADKLIKAEHEYPVTVIVEPETPEDVG